MKKTIILLAVFATTVAFAQEEDSEFIVPTGTWEFSSNLGFQSSKSEITISDSESKVWQIFVSPNLSYAFNNNWSVGGGLGYIFAESTNEVNDTINVVTRNNTIQASLFVKRYFQISDRFALSLRGGGNLTNGWSKTETNNPDNPSEDGPDTNGYGFFLNPGLTFFLSDSFALNANLGTFGYTSLTTESSNGNEQISSRFNFSVNPNSLNIGLSYFWN